MRPELSRVWIVCCAVAAGFTGGCSRPAATTPVSRSEKTEPVTVRVVHPEQRSLRRVVEQPGSIQPFEETMLFARVPGYVAQVNADIGQKVRGPRWWRSGEVLAELAVPEREQEVKQKVALARQAEAQVEQARKALAAAEANVVAVEAMVAEARAGLTRAQALYDRWGSESRRVSGLVRGGVLDVQTHDETLNQYRAAGASREEARARVTSTKAAVLKAEADRDKARADVEAAEARVDVAGAEVGRVQALLGFARIRAPFDGVVTRRRVNTGDLMQPTGGKGEWLFTVSRLDPVRVVVAVPEADAGLVQEGTEARLVIGALSGEVKAPVARTSWSLEPGSRTLRAEVDLANGDGRYRPGMYVSARITGTLPRAWVLPASAVVKQGSGRVIFRVEGGKAVRTAVEVGRTDGSWVGVLRWQRAGAWVGWTGREEVVGQGAGLVDGQVVTRR